MPAHPDLPASQPDHLVVMASTLDEGARWCEALLGVTPGPGGKHALMGTHNRLLNISSPAFPACYLEIIALDPQATSQRAPGLRRWFDMDDRLLGEQVAQHGPQLIAWVARGTDMQAAARRLANAGLDCGALVQASRPGPTGLLEWRISVRDDGQRLLGGALPTLIEWGAAGNPAPLHPTDAMPASGVQLQGLELSHPESALLQAATRALGLTQLPMQPGPPGLCATLQTPRGPVRLRSPAPA